MCDFLWKLKLGYIYGTLRGNGSRWSRSLAILLWSCLVSLPPLPLAASGTTSYPSVEEHLRSLGRALSALATLLPQRKIWVLPGVWRRHRRPRSSDGSPGPTSYRDPSGHQGPLIPSHSPYLQMRNTNNISKRMKKTERGRVLPPSAGHILSEPDSLGTCFLRKRKTRTVEHVEPKNARLLETNGAVVARSQGCVEAGKSVRQANSEVAPWCPLPA